jgi:hypothetical protein
MLIKEFRMLFGVFISGSFLFVFTSVFAEIPCVERAINWNNGGDHRTVNYVTFSTVALNSNGIASYTKGELVNKECNSLVSTSITGAGKVQHGKETCLYSNPTSALVSDRVGKNEGYDQPFNIRKPLSLQVVKIQFKSFEKIVMSQPNATYEFKPACVGDLVTGDDQWGNHWTMSFQLFKRENIH